MRTKALTLILLLLPTFGFGKRNIDLADATNVAKAANDALRNTPSLSPAEADRLREEKASAVEKIESIANAEPKDVETQLEVGKSLASVSEAPRAVPYAERGLKLAESSGDPKMIREALLTGSEVYYKAGNYDLARARAERILRDNPKDKDAMALYMQVKGRGAASSPAAKGGTAGNAGAGPTGGAPVAAQPGPGPTSSQSGAPGVAMTNAGSLEAQKQLALGWSRLSLDAKAALKNFEAAITADPLSAAVRVQRSKARLASGDAPGALGDSDDAIRMDPRLGEAYAARAEAKRALGRAEEELLTDYEEAAKLDGRFTEAYKSLVTRLTGAAPSSAAPAADAGTAGRSAPDGIRGLLSLPPKQWGLIALLCALAAALGGVLAPLALKKRRSENSTPTPRP